MENFYRMDKFSLYFQNFLFFVILCLLLPKKCVLITSNKQLLIFKNMKKNQKKSVLSLENVNMVCLTSKVNDFVAKNDLTPTDKKVRLVQLTLRHPVHHLPVNIPFIAAIRKCGEKQVVYALKRSKFAIVDDIDISSETRVSTEFTIDGVRYVQKDTINGYPRFVPLLKH